MLSKINIFKEKEKWLFKKKMSFLNYKKLVWAVIGFGFILRLVQYLSNRSLWVDEAALALNIVEKSWIELWQPLDHQQGAPIGFLMLEKLSITLFGNNEYALRLIPFLSGNLALILFYNLAKKVGSKKAVLVSLILFANSYFLIFYSAEVKQYSLDMLLTVITLLYTINIQKKAQLKIYDIILISLFGGILIWFSHPIVFVLAGIGISLYIHYLKNREFNNFINISIAYGVWSLSFVTCYIVSLSKLSSDETLLNSWSRGFLPFPPLSLSDLVWYFNTFINLFDNPVGIKVTGLAGFLFIIACWACYSLTNQKFYLLIMPIIMTLLASFLHKYPFTERLLLFLVPVFILFIGLGTDYLIDQLQSRKHLIGTTLLVVLLFYPVTTAIWHLYKPITKEEIKPVLNYVKNNQQEEDQIYVYYAARLAFTYYQDKYGFTDDKVILGNWSNDNKNDKHWDVYFQDLNQLINYKRVWVIFAHVPPAEWRGTGVDEERLYLYKLNKEGKSIDAYKNVGASVYLYQMQ